jgi:DNA-binding NarL/FixJ family response regulator
LPWAGRASAPTHFVRLETGERIHVSRISLTPLELNILRGLANGMQSKEIAAAVNRRTATIELHVRTLFAKFNARSRAHLVARAICDGTIGSHDVDSDSVGVARW